MWGVVCIHSSNTSNCVHDGVHQCVCVCALVRIRPCITTTINTCAHSLPPPPTPLPIPLPTLPSTLPSVQVVSEELGHKLDKVDLSMLGQAKKISITKDDTIVLHGAGTKEALQERIDQIQDAIAQATSDYDRWGGDAGDGDVESKRGGFNRHPLQRSLLLVFANVRFVCV